jgi:hypothetical protein
MAVLMVSRMRRSNWGYEDRFGSAQLSGPLCGLFRDYFRSAFKARDAFEFQKPIELPFGPAWASI